MKKLLILSALFIFGCSNTPEKPRKTIFVWNYYTTYDELDEKTTFKSKVYSTTQNNFDFPYGDAKYFLEIKTIIPDNIKTFDEYLYYSSRTQTNLINIKCSGCPLYDYDRQSLKYKIDKKKPDIYTGYSAVKDNDELNKYSFIPDIGADGFVKNILGEQNHTKLLIEFPTLGKGNKQISFNISNFNLLDVIKRNHFSDDKKTNPKAEKLSPSSAKEIIEIPEADTNYQKAIINDEEINIENIFGVWEGIQEPYYLVDKFGDYIEIRGKRVLIPEVKYSFLLEENNQLSIKQRSDGSSYNYSGTYGLVNSNDNNLNLSCQAIHDKHASLDLDIEYDKKNDFIRVSTKDKTPNFNLTRKGTITSSLNTLKTAIINVDNLNFRSTPEISDNIIGTLKFEEKVIFVDSISIESNNIKKGTLNKNIIVDFKGRKFNFNKHKVVEIDGPDGDYALVVNIEVGNGEYILASIPTSDIDLSNKKTWARIKKGNKKGYVYYKFLNFN